jgi:hypothetical protein
VCVCVCVCVKRRTQRGLPEEHVLEMCIGNTWGKQEEHNKGHMPEYTNNE